MYFDSHAHLNDRAFDGDREAVVTRMLERGVTEVMNVGCCLESSRACIALAERYPFVYAAVGSHPDHADLLDDSTLDQYRAMAAHEKVRAIGEIGLDYHYEDVPRAVQQAAFRRQMALAGALRLPVIVHEREAHGDAMTILDEFPGVTGVFHCYSGSWEMAKILLLRGWYLGFTGVLTFKNAKKAVEVAANAPLDRLLIETDCPYMAPEPHRGKRNDPSYLPLTAARLAELRGITPEEAGETTASNARRLFGIE
ncbi:MAG: TatD family hydrolase [Oscillospiraceae bacterium]|nr:TatD family hydrolase [Oscillospiraceae bacterium]